MLFEAVTGREVQVRPHLGEALSVGYTVRWREGVAWAGRGLPQG